MYISYYLSSYATLKQFQLYYIEDANILAGAYICVEGIKKLRYTTPNNQVLGKQNVCVSDFSSEKNKMWLVGIIILFFSKNFISTGFMENLSNLGHLPGYLLNVYNKMFSVGAKP